MARKTPPKGTLRFAVREVLAEPDRVGDGKDALLADLLRRPEPHGWGRSVAAAAAAEVGEARLALVLLAQVAADREATMNEGTWRNANRPAARWFTFLASTGYSLADIEQRVVNDAQVATTQGDCDPGEGKPDGDDGGGGGQWDQDGDEDGSDPAA